MQPYIVIKDKRVFIVSASNVDDAIERIGSFLPPEHNKQVQFVGALPDDVYYHIVYGNANEIANVLPHSAIGDSP